MKKVIRKDAPKQKANNKQHWSDRHKILISIVAWTVLILSFGLLTYMGESMR